MTVQQFLRTYFELGSEVRGILVQKNVDGELMKLYSSSNGYQEQFMKPQVGNAEIVKWGIDTRHKRIWIAVE